MKSNSKQRLFEVMGKVNPSFNQQSPELVDFDAFPPEVRDTLDNEYGRYQHSFDWNSKQDEFRNNPEGFTAWLKKDKSEQFLKNLDNIIKMTTRDMILLKRKKIADMKLKAFEELIIPTLGDEIATHHLSKFEELVLMNPYATAEEIAKGFREAKSIFDTEGNIDPLKIEKSKIFTGGEVNLPAFERFIQKYPEFQGAFNHWKKLFDEDMDLTLTDLNAFRNSTPIDKIRDLRNFLIDYRNNKIK